MIRKNIFKLMALALLMPAMMLLTACGNEDEVVNPEKTQNGNTQTESTAQKGYPLQVTVNATRKDTRAHFNESTMKLEFSAGDKLYVYGNHDTVGFFAGTLDMVSEGTFSGTIYTTNPYDGTADALLSGASLVGALLLPNDFGTYKYLSISGSGCSTEVSLNPNRVFTTSKTTALEQFSYEYSFGYSSGFALTPDNAILNFTITGLTPSTEVNVALTGPNDLNISEKVTTNASGTATFAIGIKSSTDLNNLSLTVGGNAIPLASGSKTLEAGKIYNINRSVVFSNATAEDVGKVIGANGRIYTNVSAASAAGTTAVAMIAYVGSAGSVDTGNGVYKGLAIAMSDANGGSACQWYTTYAEATCVSKSDDLATALGFKNGIASTKTLTTDGHTHAAATAARNNNGTAAPSCTSGWFLPSIGQWNLIVKGIVTKKAGSEVAVDLTESLNRTYVAYKNLNPVINDAGGSSLQEDSGEEYWSSSEYNSSYIWNVYFGMGEADTHRKDYSAYVRSVLAF